MILSRTGNLTGEFTDAKRVALDNDIDSLFREGATIRTGSYVGTGIDGFKVQTGFSPVVLLVWKTQQVTDTVTFPIAGAVVLALRENKGVSYNFLNGNNILDGVLEIGNGFFTVGLNNAVNQDGQKYIWIGIG